MLQQNVFCAFETTSLPGSDTTSPGYFGVKGADTHPHSVNPTCCMLIHTVQPVFPPTLATLS
jgi:hypothetical protein